MIGTGTRFAWIALTTAGLWACGGRSQSLPRSSGGSNAGAAGGARAGAPADGSSQGGAHSAGSPTGGTQTNGGEIESSGGISSGGAAEAGGAAAGDGMVGGSGGSPPAEAGPCDIYREAGQPCVAAYSTVRRLLAEYEGPLYQIRSQSSLQNTGSGGKTQDVPQTSDGFADLAKVKSACAQTFCSVSVIYDQSGNGNHLSVAKAGPKSGGPNADQDDFEASATPDSFAISGRQAFPLYLDARQGYRLPGRGNGVPRGQAAQGIYLLADGTRAATGCCWEFGNAVRPAIFGDPSALFFGAEMGNRGAGPGPWFLADFGGGNWAGGSAAGDPGFGAGSLWSPVPPNPANPSLPSQLALGFLKLDRSGWALRMADASADSSTITTAYQGKAPKSFSLDGSVVLGVSSENGNDSWGTFYEGAIVAGFPSDDTEHSILENIRAAGYGR